MSTTVRFWGRVIAIRPRLTLTKFAGETHAKSAGHILLMEGTRQVSSEKPASEEYRVAIGAATRTEKAIGVGDLLRGDAHPVPAETPDVLANLYRVGVLRVIAHAGQPGASSKPAGDPPRTDSPLTTDEAEVAPRRVLQPENLDTGGPCHCCPYGAVVPVVRLSDPRNLKTGVWSYVPACLGPVDCPHYESS